MASDRNVSAYRRVRRGLLGAFRRLLGVQWIVDQIGLVRGEVQALNAALARNGPAIQPIVELRSLLDQVELYQPIFQLAGLPTFMDIGPAKRACDDRIAAIRASAGGNLKGVRVLDVGSSLGYVSLSLAQDGALVLGLDSSPQNAAASRLISRISGVPAEFRCGAFDEGYVDQIPSNHYDLGIFLSVFHHIIEAAGLDQARALVRGVLAKIPVCYFELAVKEEDGAYSWKDRLPDSPLALFEGLDADLELLGSFPTHLSSVARPLYRVSRKCVIAVNGKVYSCRETAAKAYRESPVMTNRKYHFADGFVIKEVFAESAESFDGILQTLNEIAVVRTIQRKGPSPVGAGIEFSSLVDFEISRQRVLLVLKLAPGDLLSDSAASLDESQKLGILTRVEKAVLHLEERHAIHHNDLRLWNLIFDRKTDRLTLIDFGLAGPVEGEDASVALAWLTAELDQGRILSLQSRRTVAEVENVPWRSPALHERFERYKGQVASRESVSRR